MTRNIFTDSTEEYATGTKQSVAPKKATKEENRPDFTPEKSDSLTRRTAEGYRNAKDVTRKLFPENNGRKVYYHSHLAVLCPWTAHVVPYFNLFSRDLIFAILTKIKLKTRENLFQKFFILIAKIKSREICHFHFRDIIKIPRK